MGRWRSFVALVFVRRLVRLNRGLKCHEKPLRIIESPILPITC